MNSRVRLSGHRKSYIWAGGVFLVGLAITGLLWRDLLVFRDIERQHEFSRKLHALESSFETRMNAYVAVLQGARGLFAASEAVTQHEFKEFIESQHVFQRYPGMTAMSYAEYVLKSQKYAFLEQLSREGHKGVLDNPVVESRFEQDQPSYVFLRYSVPAEKAAFGLNLMHEQARISAIEKTRDTGEPQATDVVRFVDGRVGFHIYLAVYEPNMPLGTVEERRKAFKGIVTLPVAAEQFFKVAFADMELSPLMHIQVTDGSAENGALLYSSATGAVAAHVNPQYEHIHSDVSVGGKIWRIHLSVQPNYTIIPGAMKRMVWVLILGTLASALAALLAWMFMEKKSLAEKTADIAQKSVAVQSEVIAEMNERFTQAFEHAATGMVLVSTDGTWMRVNPAFQQMVGYSEQELVGKPFADIGHPEEFKRDNETMRDLLKGNMEIVEREKRFKHKKGQYVWGFVSASLVRNVKGKPLYFVAQIQDITERKREDAVKSEFTSLVSHQLRTPLTAMRWALEKLERTSRLGAAPKKLLQACHNATLRMNEIIGTILTVSRLETGKLTPEHSTVEVHTMLQGVVEGVSADLQKPGVHIDIDCPEAITLETDEQLLKDILVNLISNAVKYTNEGGNVRISVQKKATTVDIAVADTGIGIPIAQQSHIPGRFFRAENATETDGTGIGLYLSYAIATLLGASIEFVSEPNKGTTFTLHLPLTRNA